MKRVYVAGPITQGDRTLNIRRGMLAGLALLRAGYAPYVPHLCHFLELLDPQPYGRWVLLSLTWLEQSEILIRLPGESEGADNDVRFATRTGIPVFDSVEAFLSDEGWLFP